jgi:hypothetical protein
VNLRRTAIVLVLLAAGRAASACELPTLVAIPAADALGERAANIIVATERYVTGIKAYVACVQAELAAAGGDAAPASLRNQLIARNNHAVAEAEAVLGQFRARVAPPEDLYLARFVSGDGDDCIQTPRLRSTSVINDIAVLFIERDGSASLNVLEQACPDLDRFGRFDVHRNIVGASSPNLGPVQTNRLCSAEFIEPYAFETSTRRSRPCALGRFFELTGEQAAQLMALRAAARPPAAEQDRQAETPARQSSEP